MRNPKICCFFHRRLLDFTLSLGWWSIHRKLNLNCTPLHPGAIIFDSLPLIFIMIGRSLALLALLALASQNANAFTTSSFLSQKHFTLSMAADKPDLSIPYDAAARLAYNEWCDTYEKTRDDSRFATFKANYEAISVANIKAKKAAKEAGEEVPTQLTLNEFGDFTAAEYQAMQSGAAAPAGGDFLKNAMEAAMSQSEASIALGEAVDALAEEEQVRSIVHAMRKIKCEVSFLTDLHSYWPNNLAWAASRRWKPLWTPWMVSLTMVANWNLTTSPEKLASVQLTWDGAKKTERNLTRGASGCSCPTFWPWRSMPMKVAGQ
jgi:hypothetical protein